MLKTFEGFLKKYTSNLTNKHYWSAKSHLFNMFVQMN